MGLKLLRNPLPKDLESSSTAAPIKKSWYTLSEYIDERTSGCLG